MTLEKMLLAAPLLLLPAFQKVQDAADRGAQGEDNLLLAFTLERYRLDQGRYPQALNALAPGYLPEVPRDLTDHLIELTSAKLSARSQARALVALRQLFRFLKAERLCELAEAKGRYFGTAMTQNMLSNSTITTLAGQQFDMVTPGNEMKWDTTESRQNSFNFGPGDQIVSWAKAWPDANEAASATPARTMCLRIKILPGKAACCCCRRSG